MKVGLEMREGADTGRCLQLSIGQIQPQQDWGTPEGVVGKGPPFLLFLIGIGWLVCCRESLCSKKSSSVRSVMVFKAHQEYSDLFPERFDSYLFIYLYGSGVEFATNCSISPVAASSLGCQKYLRPCSKGRALFLGMLQMETAFFLPFP